MLTIKTDDLRINVVAIKGENLASSEVYVEIFYTGFDDYIPDNSLVSINDSGISVMKKNLCNKPMVILQNTLQNILSTEYYEEKLIFQDDHIKIDSVFNRFTRDAISCIREAYTFEEEFWSKASARNEDLIYFPRD